MKKSEKLLDAIGQIDEKWIYEAAQEAGHKAGSKRRTGIPRWQSALAACALVAIVIGVYGLTQGSLLQENGRAGSGIGQQSGDLMQAAPQEAAGEAGLPEAAAAVADEQAVQSEKTADQAAESVAKPETAEISPRTVQDGDKGNADAEQKEQTAQKEDMYLAVEVTESTANGITFVMNNPGPYPVTYGEAWYLEQYVDEIWQEVIPLAEYGWKDLLYELKSGEQKEVTIDWSTLYGTLSPGQYRVVRSATVEKDSTEEALSVHVDFEVDTED